jgi:hypothetical protein
MQRTITALLKQLCSLATTIHTFLPEDRNHISLKLTFIGILISLKEASLEHSIEGQ